MKKTLILIVLGYVILSLLDMYILATREPYWKCQYEEGKD